MDAWIRCSWHFLFKFSSIQLYFILYSFTGTLQKSRGWPLNGQHWQENRIVTGRNLEQDPQYEPFGWVCLACCSYSYVDSVTVSLFQTVPQEHNVKTSCTRGGRPTQRWSLTGCAVFVYLHDVKLLHPGTVSASWSCLLNVGRIIPPDKYEGLIALWLFLMIRPMPPTLLCVSVCCLICEPGQKKARAWGELNDEEGVMIMSAKTQSGLRDAFLDHDPHLKSVTHGAHIGAFAGLWGWFNPNNTVY